MRDNKTNRIAEAAKKVIDAGNDNPHVSEIVSAYLGPEAAEYQFIIEEFKGKLPSVMVVLRSTYSLSVYPMAQAFFDNDRILPDEASVSIVVASGRGKETAGFHVAGDIIDDPIALWWLRTNQRSANGKGQKVAEALNTEVINGRMCPEDAREIAGVFAPKLVGNTITASETARRIGANKATVTRWLKSGQMTGWQDASGRWHVDEREAERIKEEAK